MNPCNNHHRSKVTTLQRLRSTIRLSELPRKLNLVILEVANTTYAPILILITQKYIEIDVWKVLFQPISCAFFTLYFYSFIFSHSLHSNFFLFSFRGIHISSKTSTKTNRKATSKIIQTFYINEHHHSCQHQKNGVLKHTFWQQQP